MRLNPALVSQVRCEYDAALMQRDEWCVKLFYCLETSGKC